MEANNVKMGAKKFEGAVEIATSKTEILISETPLVFLLLLTRLVAGAQTKSRGVNIKLA